MPLPPPSERGDTNKPSDPHLDSSNGLSLDLTDIALWNVQQVIEGVLDCPADSVHKENIHILPINIHGQARMQMDKSGMSHIFPDNFIFYRNPHSTVPDFAPGIEVEVVDGALQLHVVDTERSKVLYTYGLLFENDRPDCFTITNTDTTARLRTYRAVDSDCVPAMLLISNRIGTPPYRVELPRDFFEPPHSQHPELTDLAFRQLREIIGEKTNIRDEKIKPEQVTVQPIEMDPAVKKSLVRIDPNNTFPDHFIYFDERGIHDDKERYKLELVDDANGMFLRMYDVEGEWGRYEVLFTNPIVDGRVFLHDLDEGRNLEIKRPDEDKRSAILVIELTGSFNLIELPADYLRHPSTAPPETLPDVAQGNNESFPAKFTSALDFLQAIEHELETKGMLQKTEDESYGDIPPIGDLPISLSYSSIFGTVHLDIGRNALPQDYQDSPRSNRLIEFSEIVYGDTSLAERHQIGIEVMVKAETELGYKQLGKVRYDSTHGERNAINWIYTYPIGQEPPQWIPDYNELATKIDPQEIATQFVGDVRQGKFAIPEGLFKEGVIRKTAESIHPVQPVVEMPSTVKIPEEPVQAFASDKEFWRAAQEVFGEKGIYNGLTSSREARISASDGSFEYKYLPTFNAIVLSSNNISYPRYVLDLLGNSVFRIARPLRADISFEMNLKVWEKRPDGRIDVGTVRYLDGKRGGMDKQFVLDPDQGITGVLPENSKMSASVNPLLIARQLVTNMEKGKFVVPEGFFATTKPVELASTVSVPQEAREVDPKAAIFWTAAKELFNLYGKKEGSEPNLVSFSVAAPDGKSGCYYFPGSSSVAKSLRMWVDKRMLPVSETAGHIDDSLIRINDTGGHLDMEVLVWMEKDGSRYLGRVHYKNGTKDTKDRVLKYPALPPGTKIPDFIPEYSKLADRITPFNAASLVLQNIAKKDFTLPQVFFAVPKTTEMPSIVSVPKENEQVFPSIREFWRAADKYFTTEGERRGLDVESYSFRNPSGELGYEFLPPSGSDISILRLCIGRRFLPGNATSVIDDSLIRINDLGEGSPEMKVMIWVEKDGKKYIGSVCFENGEKESEDDIILYYPLPPGEKVPGFIPRYSQLICVANPLEVASQMLENAKARKFILPDAIIARSQPVARTESAQVLPSIEPPQYPPGVGVAMFNKWAGLTQEPQPPKQEKTEVLPQKEVVYQEPVQEQKFRSQELIERMDEIGKKWVTRRKEVGRRDYETTDEKTARLGRIGTEVKIERVEGYTGKGRIYRYTLTFSGLNPKKAEQWVSEAPTETTVLDLFSRSSESGTVGQELVITLETGKLSDPDAELTVTKVGRNAGGIMHSIFQTDPFQVKTNTPSGQTVLKSVPPRNLSKLEVVPSLFSIPVIKALIDDLADVIPEKVPESIDSRDFQREDRGSYGTIRNVYSQSSESKRRDDKTKQVIIRPDNYGKKPRHNRGKKHRSRI